MLSYRKKYINNNKRFENFPKLLFFCLTLIIIAMFISNPYQYMNATLNGLVVFGTNVFPALFPFFILTKILTELGFVQKISEIFSPVTKRLYNCSGVSAYIYFISIMSGYPVGAKLCGELYEKNIVTTDELKRIIPFTSTSGPLFIVGTVGVGMLQSFKAGVIILICHFVSALLNGLIYRKVGLNKTKVNKNLDLHFKQNNENITNIISSSVYSSCVSIILVGGYICLFFMLILLINNLHLLLPISLLTTKIFHINVNDAINIWSGLIEVTKGCLGVSSISLPLFNKTLICGGLISFGGLSIFCQAFAFLHKCNISFLYFVGQKTTHSLICIVLILLLKFLF